MVRLYARRIKKGKKKGSSLISVDSIKTNGVMVYGEVAKQSSQPKRRLCSKILPLVTAFGKASLPIITNKREIGCISISAHSPINH
jgi:hypothetical protein